ncbi:SufB/SufD family protein [Stomatohabitans albus]|uniref:SufB/SufD family protein n=1 Tax=Stomatohabitans albus TaxID=3110766 RepID=UPI00300C93C8
MTTIHDHQSDAEIRSGALAKPTNHDEDYRFSDPAFFDLDLPIITKSSPAGELGHLAQATVDHAAGNAVVVQLVDTSVHLPADLPDGVTIAPLKEAPKELVTQYLGSVISDQHDYFIANTLARFNTGVLVHLAKNTEVSEPIVIDITTTEPGLAVQWVLVVSETGANGTVVVDQHGGANETTVLNAVETVLQDASQLTLVTAQDWAGEAISHMATHKAQVGRDASFTHLEVSLKGAHVYVRPDVELAGRGAHAQLLGVYLPTGTDHIEHRSLIHHVGSDSVSEYNHKGVICDAGRATWVGTIKIDPDAKNTSSDESNANLILSDGRADSLPFLEIGTADVTACGHHSSIGQIDEVQLFYLQSRGIDRIEARRMLVLAFLAEVIDDIDIAGLSDILMDDISTVIAK